MNCKWLEAAHLWRNALMEAELIWTNILNVNDKLLMNKYGRLLRHYNHLHSVLIDAVAMETEADLLPFWEHILMGLKLGGDVLADLAEFGILADRGKKAALQRMKNIKDTQFHLKYSEEFINKNQKLYNEHWFKHPRLIFEIPKAALHELPALITYKGKALVTKNPEAPPICTHIINHYAFTRELAYQTPDIYLTLKEAGKLVETDKLCLKKKCQYYEVDMK